MYTHADKVKKNTRKSAANRVPCKQDDGQSTFQFSANHPAVMQRQLREKVSNGHQVKQFKTLQEMVGNSTQNKMLEQCQKSDHNDTEQDLDNYKKNEEPRLLNPHESIVQRQLIRKNEADSAPFDEAFPIFWESLKKQGGEIEEYLKFVENRKNNHNLIFRTTLATENKKGELHGVTDVTFNDDGKDILAYMFEKDIKIKELGESVDEIMENIDLKRINALNGVSITISIVINKSSDKAYILETLNHEFTVHAIKWYKFIESVYTDGRIEEELRERILAMPSDHDEFGLNKNELYKQVRDSIIENYPNKDELTNQEEPNLLIPDLLSLNFQDSEKRETVIDKLKRISAEAIREHRPYEKLKKDDKDLMQKIEELDTNLPRFTRGPSQKTPLLGNRKKNKSKKSDSCCYITTACVQFKGLHDDCEELTLLRKFRDTYLIQKKNGDELIDLYYEYSPAIVESIELRNDKDKIYQRLYKIIRQCVDAIKNGNNEFAYQVYCEMVINLKEEFAPDLNIAIPSLS